MRRRGSIVWPLVLITLGVLFLLANFQVIPDVGAEMTPSLVLRTSLRLLRIQRVA